MRCIYCGAPLGPAAYCPGCGADVSLQQRIVRISNLLYNRGLEKAQVRDLSGAISCLKQSLKFNKENIDARNLLGLCYFETGEVVSALVEWVVSKNMKPEKNLASGYIDTLQTNRNKLDQINQSIRKYNQSIQYCREGSEDMAVMQLKRVISKNPKMVKAYQLLALIYIHEEEYEKARRLLRRASAIDNTNTTTLRYMTEAEDELKRSSAFLFHAKSRKTDAASDSADPDHPEEKTVRYQNGGETIIAPVTFRDSSSIATFINISLGLLLGAAVVWFLTVPALRQSIQDKANQQVMDANMTLASTTATMQDQQDQIDSAKADADAARRERDDALDTAESYQNLLKAADNYVTGDQTSAIDELGALNADDFDGNALQLYRDLNSMVGDALFTQYYTDGTTAYVHGDYSTAASQLQAAVDSDPEGDNARYYDALYYLGFAYYNAGDTAKADETFQAFIAKYPNEAGQVQAYISGTGSDDSGSQGEASLSTNPSSQGTVAETDAAAGGSADGNAASGTADSSGSADEDEQPGTVVIQDGTVPAQETPQVAWTDPTTGQNYDMYGNPIYQ